MELLNSNNDRYININIENDFQTNLGWQENMQQLEDEILNDIINPIVNYETVRFIHKSYNDCTNNIEQSDIWFYFYFLDQNGTYTNGLDYSLVGITPRENEKMLKQSTESFFRLEFFKTPHILDNNGNIIGYEPPTRKNRRLVFAKNLTLPLGEKFYYTTLNGYIHVPVFTGSNYKNKENMYFFWFQDESVLNETNLSGTTTGNTFFVAAKFYNAKDGSIIDFTNRELQYTDEIVEENDMYYQVDIDKVNYSYQIYNFTGVTGNRIGKSCGPIKFYEKGGVGSILPTPSPTATPTLTPTQTLSPTPTPTVTSGLPPSATPTMTQTPTSTIGGGFNYYLTEKYICVANSCSWASSGILRTTLSLTVGTYYQDNTLDIYYVANNEVGPYYDYTMISILQQDIVCNNLCNFGIE